jgi:DNA-binding Lrp family transcriptional regulator
VISALLEIPQVMSLDVLSRNHDLVLTIMDTSLAHLVESVYPQLTELDGVTGLSSMVSVAMHSPASNWRLQSLDRRQVEAAQAIHREQVRRDLHVQLGPEHGPVIELLQRDGRCSAAEVARVTGTSPATARRRLSRVLASDAVSLRCDMAQPASGFPVTVQWFTRLPMSEHPAAAKALAGGLNMRMIVSTTGRANFLLTMWLPSVNDLFTAERNIERLAPGIEILETSLLLGSRKRLGWIIRADGTADGRVVVPPVSPG